MQFKICYLSANIREQTFTLGANGRFARAARINGLGNLELAYGEDSEDSRERTVTIRVLDPGADFDPEGASVTILGTFTHPDRGTQIVVAVYAKETRFKAKPEPAPESAKPVPPPALLNPDNVPAAQVPFGWRFLRLDELRPSKGVGTHSLDAAYRLMYWLKDCWKSPATVAPEGFQDFIYDNTTYVTPQVPTYFNTTSAGSVGQTVVAPVGTLAQVLAQESHNPENVPDNKIPEGWRLLRKSEIATGGSVPWNKVLRLWVGVKFGEPYSMKQSTLTGYRVIILGWTYVTPVDAPPDKELNPEGVKPEHIPAGWRLLRASEVTQEKVGERVKLVKPQMLRTAYLPWDRNYPGFYPGPGQEPHKTIRPDWTYIVEVNPAPVKVSATANGMPEPSATGPSPVSPTAASPTAGRSSTSTPCDCLSCRAMRVHNPRKVPESKVPTGWRFLREDELTVKSRPDSYAILPSVYRLKYFSSSNGWQNVGAGFQNSVSRSDTYITETVSGFINPEKVPANKIPEGWRLVHLEDLENTHLTNPTVKGSAPVRYKAGAGWLTKGPQDRYIYRSSTYITTL